MTLSELKILGRKHLKDDNIHEALSVYKEIWKQEKDAWNGFFLSQCFRKENRYDDAREVHKIVEKNYPDFKPISTEKLWLDYNEKVKDWNHPEHDAAVSEILTKTNQFDKYTGPIHIKTALSLVKYYLRSNANLSSVYERLIKLDHTLIDNKTYKYRGSIFPSDRKVYFIYLADTLIRSFKHNSYIKYYLKILGFENAILNQFYDYIIESITFEDDISRHKLALYLKYYNEELHIRENDKLNNIYVRSDIIFVSDLSHFLFCPVSYAINKTFEIPDNSSWEKDEWLNEKKRLIDRYNIFKVTGSLAESIKDSRISLTDVTSSQLKDILSSEILIDNVSHSEVKVLSNSSNTIKGVPDYIFKDDNGKMFSVTEKFSYKDSISYRTPFESDLIKHYAFLEKMDDSDLDFGYFINWYWDFTTKKTSTGYTTKKIIIISFRLYKVERNYRNLVVLNETIEKIKKFVSEFKFQVDPSKITHPRKCLNCSSVCFCNHKTGNLNEIKLPYDLSEIQLTDITQFNIDNF